MNDDTYVEKEEHHISATLYLIVGAFLGVLTAMEITVSYVHALRPVMVPVLVVLAAAKFALIAMFFMHLRYEKWMVNVMFVFPLTVAAVVFLALLGLFTFLAHQLAYSGAYGLH